MIPLNQKTLVGWILVIGALNWGLVGLLNMNIVESIFGMGMIANIVYIVVGLAGAYKAYMLLTNTKKK